MKEKNQEKPETSYVSRKYHKLLWSFERIATIRETYESSANSVRRNTLGKIADGL